MHGFDGTLVTVRIYLRLYHELLMHRTNRVKSLLFATTWTHIKEDATKTETRTTGYTTWHAVDGYISYP